MLLAILTLFPEALEAYCRASILGIAQEQGLAHIRLVDFRDFTRDRHRTVDDRPFGGGAGMVLKPEPLVECVEWLERRHGAFLRVLLGPAGRRFDQAAARQLVQEPRILFICGRYEGIDERVREELRPIEISVGDFVLSGGELAALAVTEAVVRLIPGVLGDPRSPVEESFGGPSATAGLEHPHYTRPRVFRGRQVPEVLLQGDHARIAAWRARAAEARTRSLRPDLDSPADPHTEHPS